MCIQVKVQQYKGGILHFTINSIKTITNVHGFALFMSSFIALDALNPVFHGWVIIIMVQSSGIIKGRPPLAPPHILFQLRPWFREIDVTVVLIDQMFTYL